MQMGVIIFNVIIIIIFISRLPERLKVHWTSYHKTAEQHKNTIRTKNYVLCLLVTVNVWTVLVQYIG